MEYLLSFRTDIKLIKSKTLHLEKLIQHKLIKKLLHTIVINLI